MTGPCVSAEPAGVVSYRDRILKSGSTTRAPFDSGDQADQINNNNRIHTMLGVSTEQGSFQRSIWLTMTHTR